MRALRAAAALACAVMAATSSGASAATYIYPSDDQCHACCETWAGVYQPFDFYIWIRPDERGMTGAEFKVVPCYGHFAIATQYNPRASSVEGYALGGSGISIHFDECIEGWTWMYHLTCMSPNMDYGYYTIEPHDDSGLLVAYDCTAQRDPYDMTVYAWFGFRTDCGP